MRERHGIYRSQRELNKIVSINEPMSVRGTIHLSMKVVWLCLNLQTQQRPGLWSTVGDRCQVQNGWAPTNCGCAVVKGGWGARAQLSP